MMYLWTPKSYETPNVRVRQNPNASVPEPWFPDEAPSPDVIIMPNGELRGPAEDALAKLDAAGPRGAAALGALAGFLFSGWKAAVAGGVVGYFGGKFLVNFASKALAVSSAARTVETSVSKATS